MYKKSFCRQHVRNNLNFFWSQMTVLKGQRGQYLPHYLSIFSSLTLYWPTLIPYIIWCMYVFFGSHRNIVMCRFLLQKCGCNETSSQVCIFTLLNEEPHENTLPCCFSGSRSAVDVGCTVCVQSRKLLIEAIMLWLAHRPLSPSQLSESILRQ